MEREYGPEIRTGHAAEMIVEADLLLQGIVPIRVLHKYPWDLLVPFEQGFKKLQVKAVSGPRMDGPWPGTLQWSLRKGKTRVAYEVGEIDVFALVALDTWKIAYITTEELTRPQGIITTINKRVEEMDDHARWPYLPSTPEE